MDNGTSEANNSQGRLRKSRAGHRYEVTIVAALMSAHNKLLGFATIANMSAGGAKLKLVSQVAVPQSFTLVMCGKSGPRRHCSLVWHSGNSIGVRFVRPEDETLVE